MSTLLFTAQQLYDMLTDAHCNCKQYISVDQSGLLILANESRNSYGVFEDIPITKDFIIEYDLTLGSNSNPCCNPTFGSYSKPNSAQYYGFMLSFSEGGELWRGENNSPVTAQQSLGRSSTAWYGTSNTTYHIKIERDDNTVNLYVDNVLTQTVSDNSLRNTEGGYFGFFNWDGYTCKISNVTVTSDTYSNIKKYTNASGVAEIWANIKNYITAQLLGKADSTHTHTKSEITDFPTIPTKTSDLTNDSGFLTSHQDLSGYVPRSGGVVLNGQIYARNIDDELLLLIGGTAYNKGAYIALYGKEHSTKGGQIECSCRKADGTAVILNFRPDGTAEWNNKNLAMQEDTIPRSGGAVITNYFLGRSVNTGSLMISGGTSWSSGGSLETFGSSHSSYAGQVRLQPASSDANFKVMTLAPNGTWTWNGTACQITSDQRLKQQISEIDDKLLDAWEDVELCQFKYNDAVDEKGDNARLHTGYVVQQIDNACKSHGVDVSRYGLYCHEEYSEETEEVEVEQADGTKVKETKVIREANEHYSLRYTEALIVECKYLRRCIARLTARIEELEKGNNSK